MVTTRADWPAPTARSTISSALVSATATLVNSYRRAQARVCRTTRWSFAAGRLGPSGASVAVDAAFTVPCNHFAEPRNIGCLVEGDLAIAGGKIEGMSF